jgi:oligopeptidase B
MTSTPVTPGPVNGHLTPSLSPPLDPPKAQRRPHTFTRHNHIVEDPYAWLKDAGYPDVKDGEILQYLNEENAYFEAFFAPHSELVNTLFEELKARKPEQEESVPFVENDFYYQWRFTKGAQYRTWYRSASITAETDLDVQWETLLDENTLAKGHEYFRLGALTVSPDGKKLAYSVDTNGSERYQLHVIDLSTRQALTPSIENCAGEPVWNSASDSFIYLTVNEQWRPNKALFRNLDPTAAGQSDLVIMEEADESFFLSADLSQSRQLVFLHSGDHVTTEVHYLPTADLLATPKLISKRTSGHEYYVDHQGDDAQSGRLLIRSNLRHANFDLYEVALTHSAINSSMQLDQASWQSIVTGDDHTYLTNHMAFKAHLFVEVRIDGLDQMMVLEQNGESHFIQMPEESYSLGFGTNADYGANFLRLGYTSMVTPNTVYDYALDTGVLQQRKVQQVPGGYDAKNFVTRRLMATARDGTQVPLSLVQRHDTPLDGSAPLYLYGYGAYGHAIPPAFSSNIISLLDRGFTFAIAHIRGGDDLGYHWYTQGKLQQRTNTFNDFVDCAKHLVETQYVAAGRIAIGGGSAGGELMGAVVNQAPELFGSVAAHVPFVDVLNTMLDADLPLTPMEWPEWGNPIEDPEAFSFIQSYSPYDQVRAQSYPPIMVTAGLNDPRVTYWEPAKWVAKLRHDKTDDNALVLKTNMGAGHGGQSGRFTALKELAEEYAFFLLTLDVK